jgi:hypothetical protein
MNKCTTLIFRGGAEEARRPHKPKVGGSKPPFGIPFIFIYLIN